MPAAWHARPAARQISSFWGSRRTWVACARLGIGRSRHTAYRPPAIGPIFPSSHAELSPMKTQGSNTDVVFLSGVRTGFGSFGGTLKDLSATELGAVAAKHAVGRSRVPAGAVGHTVFGSGLQTSTDGLYCARTGGLE